MTSLFLISSMWVGVIGILAGPAGVREVGWRLRPEGASIEPDETVQMALGQLREYFAGQRRDFTLPLDLPAMEPVSEAVLRALRTVRYGRDDHLRRTCQAERHGSASACHRRDHGGQPSAHHHPVSSGWWPAMVSGVTPAVNRGGTWRPNAGCWRTGALPPALV